MIETLRPIDEILDQYSYCMEYYKIISVIEDQDFFQIFEKYPKVVCYDKRFIISWVSVTPDYYTGHVCGFNNETDMQRFVHEKQLSSLNIQIYENKEN